MKVLFYDAKKSPKEVIVLSLGLGVFERLKGYNLRMDQVFETARDSEYNEVVVKLNETNEAYTYDEETGETKKVLGYISLKKVKDGNGIFSSIENVLDYLNKVEIGNI